jgi:hypothetical protein
LPKTFTRTGCGSEKVGSHTLEGVHGGAYAQHYQIESIDGCVLHLRKINGERIEVEPGVFSTRWVYTDGSPVP